MYATVWLPLSRSCVAPEHSLYPSFAPCEARAPHPQIAKDGSGPMRKIMVSGMEQHMVDNVYAVHIKYTSDISAHHSRSVPLNTLLM